MPVRRGLTEEQIAEGFCPPGKTVQNRVACRPIRTVSNHDQQTLPMQNRAPRECAARRGWVVAMQVNEVGSGASQRLMREKLMEAARRREIDVVPVWRLGSIGSELRRLSQFSAGIKIPF